MNSPSKIFAGEHIKSFPAFLFLILTSFILNAKDEYKVPDFAFPQTVTEQSEKRLQEALENGNEVMALREAINLTVAHNLLSDSQNASYQINLLDSLATDLKSPFCNVAQLLEAEILYQTYEANSYLYNQRNLPVKYPLPGDTQEWSAEMFKAEILRLISAANAPTKEDYSFIVISPLLQENNEQEKIEMTISQFIGFKSADILKKLIPQNSYSLIPFYPSQVASSIGGECEAECKKILSNLIATSDNSVIKALAVRDFSYLLPDNEREKYLNENLEKLQSTEGSGVLMFHLWEINPEKNPAQEYKSMKDYLEKYPDGLYAPLLSFAIDRITQEKIELEFPGKIFPQEIASGKVTVSNLSEGYILIFRLNSNQTNIYDDPIIKKINGSRPLHTIHFSETGELPFSYEQEISLPSLAPGLYLAVTSKSRNLPKNWYRNTSRSSYATFRVTDLAIVSTYDANENGSGRVYVVKGENQQPVEGATVKYFKGDNNKPEATLITNKEGWVKMPNGYFRIHAEYNKNKAVSEAGFSFYEDKRGNIPRASILTDLGLYRPGDTVRFAVVGWIQKKSENRIFPDTDIKVKMHGANFSVLDTVTLHLDNNGRADGSFVIPRGNLLGNYTLVADFPDFKGNSGGGSVNFQVEEYKLPAFLVTMQQSKLESSDSIEFTGKALTFSGQPVSEAKAVVSLKFTPWSWGLRMQQASFSQEVEVNDEGEFKISLPLQNLKGTIFERGRYTVMTQVTSQAGETESSSPLIFYLGSGFDIRPSLPEKIKISRDSLKLSVPVYDIAGLPVNEKVSYKIYDAENKEEVMAGGVFESPLLEIPGSMIPSGKYILEFNIDGEASAKTEAIFWRSSDRKAPCPTPLWIPESQYLYTENQEYVEIKFGSYYKDWILFALSNGTETLETKWIQPSDTLHIESIKIPEGSTPLFVSLAGMHNFRTLSSVIKIVPAKSLEKMELVTESFRENISAGDEEKWSFRFKIDNRPVPFVNAFAVMSDKALNSINNFIWDLNVWQPEVYNKFRISSQTLLQNYIYSLFNTAKSVYKNYSLIPGWNTYGFPLVAYPSYGTFGGMVYRSMATKNAMADLSSRAEKMEEAEDSAVETVMEEPQSSMTYQESEPVQLRPIEMPLAFFMPDLKSDSTGLVTLNFTVSDFNTTWQLQLAGYDNQMQTASLILDAVATKPVMVKSNLPQFVRTGDKLEISATLYNNSDTILPIGGKIVIVDPETGDILNQQEFIPEPVKAGGNRIVSSRFQIPDNVSQIAVKAYALSESHSDGEQGFIVVLPSSTPVTEAVTFYAGINQKEIQLKIPKLNKEANVTLKYCDNPIWEVLLSLPCYTTPKSPDALSISNWLFSTLSANNIVQEYPSIKEGLKKILSDENSSRSNLEKDRSLKIVTLENSPWLNTASAETEKIKNLSKYISGEDLKPEINGQIEALGKLQNSDGGWSWFEGMKSTPFITFNVLSYLGYIKNQGIDVPEFNSMIKKGVNYYDKYLIDIWEKNGTVNPVTVVDYLYVRNMSGVSLGKKFLDISRNALDSVSSKWVYFNSGEKAKTALVMLEFSDYRSQAYKITESLEQFVNKDVPLSQQSLMLDAFKKTGINESYIDRLIEKILLKKETQDWNNDNEIASVIFTLLHTFNDTIGESSNPGIFLDGKRLELPENEKSIGIFTINIDPKSASGKNLVIKREGITPAWGGLISQYMAPVKSVKRSSTSEFSIEKHIYKVFPDGKVKEVTSYKKGDQLKVVVTLNCKKDMDYVVVQDSRAACLQPDDRVSGITFKDGLIMYKQIGLTATSLYIESVPAGKHIFTYDCHADRDGVYALGITEAQCLYSPAQVAHSAGEIIRIEP